LQDPAASWVLLLARGLIVSGQLLLQRQADFKLQAGGRSVMTVFQIEPHIAAFRWLQQQLPHLQLPGAAVAAEQASSSSSSRNNKQHRQLLAQAQQLQQTLATVEQNSGQAMIKKYASQLQFIEQLVAFGQALCYALPSRACCNNPGCSNLARLTERELVSGKGCVCSRWELRGNPVCILNYCTCTVTACCVYSVSLTLLVHAHAVSPTQCNVSLLQHDSWLLG
jgi:hypothetical protein